jgi:2-amino-4-hydroxy-6-hydroxymethyldihydropteridine diphosphokinase
MKIRIAIGLGANLGDREAQLARAVERLEAVAETGSFRLASLYETPPVGPPQPEYLNSAVSFVTTLAPEAILAIALQIERDEGRVREVRWGPRTLDLDLLTALGPAGELTLDLPALTLPHPELRHRAFALAPLLEVMPELQEPYALLLDGLGGPPPIVGSPRLATPRGYKGWTGAARLP